MRTEESTVTKAVPSAPLLADHSLRDFCASLAARTPAPGGGSAAAALAATGAALAAMVCRFTTGEKHRNVSAAMEEAATRLDALREEALRLVDEDAAAYEGVSRALALPKGTEAEKAARRAAMEKALLRAMDVPIETARVAAAAIGVLAPLAATLNRNVASDLDASARCLEAAAQIALANVRVNALQLKDDARARERLERAVSLRGETLRGRDAILAAAATALRPA